MKLLIAAVLLVGLCLSTLLFAQRAPPQVLVDKINQYPILYKNICKIGKRDVSCLVFYNRMEDTAYIIYFENGDSLISLIVSKRANEKEVVLWCHFNTCV